MKIVPLGDVELIRMRKVRGEIQRHMEEVSKWESKAADHEERLGLLKNEGKCRT